MEYVASKPIGKPEEKIPLGDLRVNGRIILK
jgi:hypothetical protein